MAKKKYSAEEIVSMLRQAEVHLSQGMTVIEAVRLTGRHLGEDPRAGNQVPQERPHKWLVTGKSGRRSRLACLLALSRYLYTAPGVQRIVDKKLYFKVSLIVR
jgi:hypothetical protein